MELRNSHRAGSGTFHFAAPKLPQLVGRIWNSCRQSSRLDGEAIPLFCGASGLSLYSIGKAGRASRPWTLGREEAGDDTCGGG